MCLRVERLRLTSFRNFDDREMALSAALTVFLGRNGQGKTNAVEALRLLTAGTSFRNPLSAQLVMDGRERGLAEARLAGGGRVVDVAMEVTAGRRTFSRNGKHVQASSMPGTLMSVAFTPDDLALVKRGASGRRDELDGFGRQVSPGYARILAGYGRVVEQRNHLLREPQPDIALLDALDEQLSRAGAALLNARLRLFARLRPGMESAYGELSGGEELRCSYRCSLGDEALDLDKDALRAALAAALSQTRDESLRRQLTPVGPHRDDVAFLIAGRDARDFGSQGQQRTVVLALKAAEVALARETVGQPPLLLLDDVMSELDARRRAAVAALADGGVQTVVTTTNLSYFDGGLPAGAEVVRFGE